MIRCDVFDDCRHVTRDPGHAVEKMKYAMIVSGEEW
jgi:hypothetical protein